MVTEKTKKPVTMKNNTDAKPTPRASAIDTPEWRRLGKAIKARRDDLGMRQRDVFEAAGVSISAYTPVETGKSPYVPSTRVLRKISVALGWSADSCELILRGKQPIVAETPPAALPNVPAASRVTLDGYSGISVDLERIRESDQASYLAIQALVKQIASKIQ